MVLEEGLEPSRPFEQRILSPLRLPFRHSSIFIPRYYLYPPELSHHSWEPHSLISYESSTIYEKLKNVFQFLYILYIKSPPLFKFKKKFFTYWSRWSDSRPVIRHIMVAQARFELAHARVKVSCLTAWLLGNIIWQGL